MQTENAVSKGGLLSRWLAPKKTTVVSTFSETEKSQAAPGKVRGNKGAQKGGKKVAQKMPAPTVRDLREALTDGKARYIGEIAESLGCSMVAASRVVSAAEKAGYVRKKREGQFRFVTLVPIHELRFSQLA